ncbi:hypothetical protein G0Q06_11300 [Puniceicoccales bacterium CK1056]|uniref:asparagine synthase (glutamine-hydrolyzing) n=1 Tax=Oceanipulchritudo coccoides TaxID=2706888 RepID=A0A6B2M5T2_9BACT|nr:hypothetical protein [Oceanipulchritudo coccoides]NDV63040.1 hypothetical protein [Oceanipulchritudo coccoides]
MTSLFPSITVSKTPQGWNVSGDYQVSLGYHLPLADGHDDGMFAEWKWDGRKLIAKVDWLGVHPLFYGYHNGVLVLSNNVMRVLEGGIPATLDLAAIGVFFRLGFYVDCDTPFKFIRSFPPGGSLVWEDGNLSVTEKYPEPEYSEVTRNSEKDAYIELTRQSIGRRKALHGDFIQPVSGGRDSRHILAELVHQGVKPQYTYTIETVGKGQPNCDEAIAAAVSGRLGITHKVLNHPVSSELEREALKNILTNFTTNEGTWMLGALQVLQEQPEALYDGFLGDVLSAFHWSTCDDFLESYQKSGTTGAVDAIIRKFNRQSWDVDETLGRIFGEAPELSMDHTRQHIAQFFSKFTHHHNPITQFFIFSRGRREIAMSTWGTYPFVRNILVPYLDRDLFMFYLGLPERVELPYGETRSEAISSAFPALKGLPYAMSPRMTKGSALRRRVLLLKNILQGGYSGLGCRFPTLAKWAGQSVLNRNNNQPDFISTVYLEQVQQIPLQAQGGAGLAKVEEKLGHLTA